MDYNAPFESPIEQQLMVKLTGHLTRDVEVRLQVPYQTRCGSFRVDALLTRGDTRVAIESDGRDFHDWRRDEWRDAMLLGEKHVTDVVRFGGRYIMEVPLACVYSLAIWFPQFFTDRAFAVLESACGWLDPADVSDNNAYGRWSRGEYDFFIAFRRSARHQDMWQTKYKFALSVESRSIEHLAKLWQSSGRAAEAGDAELGA